MDIFAIILFAVWSLINAFETDKLRKELKTVQNVVGILSNRINAVKEYAEELYSQKQPTPQDAEVEKEKRKAERFKKDLDVINNYSLDIALGRKVNE